MIFLVLSRNVLELGCGVGLSGLVALHYCRPKTYFFTDCHDKVLEKVQINLEINGFVQTDKCQQILNTPAEGGCTNELNSRQGIQGYVSIQNEIWKEQEVPRQDIQTIGSYPLKFYECFSSCENFGNFPFVKPKDCGFQRKNLEKGSTHAVESIWDFHNLNFKRHLEIVSGLSYFHFFLFIGCVVPFLILIPFQIHSQYQCTN